MEALIDSRDLTGKTFGDYRVLRRLGEGGMGQVYLSEQISLKRPVALKILKPELAVNPTALQRFKAEAEAVAKASHPNIVQVYAIGDLNGLPYMALEYVDGFTLRDYLTKKGPPTVALALSIMRQGAAALQRASELGIVHRDIKPENILLTRKGSVKIADFGLSRCLTPEQQPLNLTQTGVTMGTPLYMSPEQVQGKPLDPRSDIYSFGVTCYHMLAGSPPFTGETAFDVALQHVQAAPESLDKVRPDLPSELCAAVHKMMAKKVDERYQTARELLRDVIRIREQVGGDLAQSETVFSTLATSQTGTPPAAAVPGRRLRQLLIVGTIVTALAAGALAGWLTRRQASETALLPVEPEPSERETEKVGALNRREQTLWDDAREFAGGAAVTRMQGLRSCFQLAILYFEQRRFDDADRFFSWLNDQKQARDLQTLGRLGQAMVLAFRDRTQESTELFVELWAGKDAPIGRLTPVLNRNPPFLKWVVKALDRNAVNLAAASKSLPAELEALRAPRPLPTKPGTAAPPNRPAAKSG